MKKEVSLILSPFEAFDESSHKHFVSKISNIPENEITDLRIIRKSIDARGRNIKFNISFEIFVGEKASSPIENSFNYNNVENKPEVIVIGSGPAGLFASLRLIELGLRPVIIERGKPVDERKADVDILENKGILNIDSNYCFGEGGAGTFSDGKLYTRSRKRGDINRILEIFYLHGSHENILYESHPHIGSDKLPGIIANIRNTILQSGGIINFNSKITEIATSGNRISYVLTEKQEKLTGKAYILTTGHSARDIYYLLNTKGILIESKPFAMGVRVEHPQDLINSIQYHSRDNKYLPAASYNVVEQVNKRGVYSFCMCPGGQIVPSATSNYEIVVNGMSLSQRNSLFANSGIVVQVIPEDYRSYQNYGGLAGLHLQELLEQKAYKQVHEGQKAPAQRVTDFCSGKSSQDLPQSSYLPGISASPMHEWLPDFIKNNLKEGFKKFDNKMKGFLSREAIMVGVESRTSSPVRIPRNPETGNHIKFENLFSAGEGAGYAGGIVSSAVDGENIAVKCADFINSQLH